MVLQPGAPLPWEPPEGTRGELGSLEPSKEMGQDDTCTVGTLGSPSLSSTTVCKGLSTDALLRAFLLAQHVFDLMASAH